MNTLPNSVNNSEDFDSVGSPGTVYVVDDDAAVRSSISAICLPERLEVIGYATAENFLSGLPIQRPACVLVDLRLPDIPGDELLKVMAERGVECSTLILSGYADVPTAVACMQSGARSVIEKPCSPEQVIQQIRQAIWADLERLEATHRFNELLESEKRLSPRELVVLDLILKGALNKQMASKLRVSQRTIEVDRSKIMQKFGCNSVAELVAKATELRLLCKNMRVDSPSAETPGVETPHINAAYRKKSVARLPGKRHNG